MNKFLKIVLIIIAALAALFIALCIYVVLAVDTTKLKDEIAKTVKERTGRELTFEGDIGFNFFPWLGLEIGPTALGNAPGFAPDEMVRINRAEASIRLLPLLSGNVAVGNVVLDGLTLNLAKNKQGVTNWDDLAGAGADAEKPAEKATPKEETAKSESSASLSVEGVEITNANIIYDDMQAGKKTAINDLDLFVGQIGDKTRFPFELKFRLKLDSPKIDTRPVLTGFAKFDQEAGSFEVDDMELSLLNLELTGLFFAKTKDDATSFSSEIKMTTSSIRELLAGLGMTPPDTADPDVLKPLAATIKVNGTDTQASLESLSLKFDQTLVTGQGSVKNFQKPAIAFNVNVDGIDVDRYLPPKSEGNDAQPAADSASSPEAPAQEPDLSALKDLDLKGKLTVGKLKVMNLTITDILAEITAQNGLVTADPMNLNLYGGSYSARGTLDASKPVAAWTESGRLKNVQAGPLLKDLTGNDRLSGTTNAQYDLTGAGLTPDNIKKSVSGTASFAFTDGAISGINVAKMLRDGWERLKGRPVSGDEPAKTDFAELLGSATLTNGHIVNKDLLMKSPLLRVTGQGWADLPKNSTDYTATVTVVGTLEGQDGKSIEDLKGLPLPINVKGSLNNPSISLDLKAMGEALFQGTFKEGAKGIEKTIKENILGGSKPSGETDAKPADKPGGFIKGLFQ
ncbi:AsmA family protein [Pseudodesulfovibrio thermohalotolerans]|uniref:AsmA family protein n=1 Tax=Pseudodesulfovibrio thermohalotolerans TaxID=2880651 RepID=UPI002442D954|nr:AsmA family protein [Pseudodesulfovibrio thermohalotolerans]WFS62112.1 AsmA family protein [Pseudodesulfovibrio thermohalotolerans]